MSKPKKNTTSTMYDKSKHCQEKSQQRRSSVDLSLFFLSLLAVCVLCGVHCDTATRRRFSGSSLVVDKKDSAGKKRKGYYPSAASRSFLVVFSVSLWRLLKNDEMKWISKVS